ncbi:uncharacterized protein AC631_05789 [Debaryomyces fabryi]|uniref:FAD-binding PCMH-type domain-containing protein n=1 Tax=Debaryomyces fabryi TaxID=58627 RepID=A0A0V1PQK1_9ASCO|nr:uncharacterized protein AC631_05789 [Debaryomyces fabryi]KRZ98450.1 hypothetical protein AC631_05789 [Debaryomyces fabryi]CUM49442.1 unnamed protein product [Debaryomyces fabryi]
MSNKVNPGAKVPTLDETYSGIPHRMEEFAYGLKQFVLGNTNKDNKPRTEDLPVLPPGINRSGFNIAIEQLKGLVGNENVELNDQERLEDGWYNEHPNTHDSFHLLDENDLVSSGAVYPGSTEDVQSIVKWANRWKIPLYSISMGRNFGYGGAAPRLRGSIVVDLGRRMNRILKLNNKSYTCLLEPGVSYFKLYDEIKKNGYDMWVDPPDIGGGSILGNALERGVGYTPYGDHWGTHCGMEVVLPNGEVYRSGMGAIENSQAWQASPYGFGPYLDGIFSQGNYGIVTKMGFWLMPDPGGYSSHAITFDREEDFGQIIEIIREIRVRHISGNVAQLNSAKGELTFRYTKKELGIKGNVMTKEDVERCSREKLKHGPYSWIFFVSFYGPTEVRTLSWNLVKKMMSKVSDVHFYDEKDYADGEPDNFHIHHESSMGIPQFIGARQASWYPNGSHSDFTPVSPITAKDAKQLLDLVYRLQDKYQLDSFPNFVVGVRDLHMIDFIMYDKKDPEMRRKAQLMLRELISEGAKLGYGEYRTHLALQDQVMNTYGFNSCIHRRLCEVIKDAVDPNGILSPGKAGVWPQWLRGKGWEWFGTEVARKWSDPTKGKHNL